jgi:hypothetical protein
MSTYRFNAIDGMVQSRQLDALSAPYRSHLLVMARMAEREREPIPLPALQVSHAAFRLFTLFSRSRNLRRHELRQRRRELRRPLRLSRRVACALRPAAC